VSELRLIAQLALGLVFGLACTAKLRAPAAFVNGVVEYEVLPRPAALALGVLLIPLEGLLAASLLSGWMAGVALPVAMALLAAFAVAVAINLARHREVPCHCLGGGPGETISPRTLARLALLLGGVALVAADRTAWGPPLTRWTAARTAGGEDLMHAVMLAALLLAAGVWLLHAPELWTLARSAPAPPGARSQAARRSAGGGRR
jgi:hypothetical protein